jgi:hypothetical protein
MCIRDASACPNKPRLKLVVAHTDSKASVVSFGDVDHA